MYLSAPENSQSCVRLEKKCLLPLMMVHHHRQAALKHASEMPYMSVCQDLDLND